MNLDEYQEEARKTAIHPTDDSIPYLALAICGEAGELAEKVKKVQRDKRGLVTEDAMEAMAKELGDIMWYAANFAKVINYSLSEIARMNLDKIADRIKRGVLHGKGDNR